MNALIAQGRAAAWSFGEIMVAVVIVCAVIGVVLVACRAFGVAIPQWLVHIVIICVVAAVAICAIRFLLTL